MLFLSVHLAPSFLSLSFSHTYTRFSLPRDQEIPCKRFRPYILAILQHSMKSRSTSGAGNKTCNLPEFVNGSSSMITFSSKYIERIRKYQTRIFKKFDLDCSNLFINLNSFLLSELYLHIFLYLQQYRRFLWHSNLKLTLDTFINEIENT